MADTLLHGNTLEGKDEYKYFDPYNVACTLHMELMENDKATNNSSYNRNNSHTCFSQLSNLPQGFEQNTGLS